MVDKKNLTKLIGKAFIPSTVEGAPRYDCYSCAKEVFKAYSIKIPEHFLIDTYDTEGIDKLIDLQARGNWTQINEPVVPCIVTFKFNSKFVNHVGVYIGAGQFIHNREKIGVNIDRIDSPAWRHRISGFYVYSGDNKSSQ